MMQSVNEPPRSTGSENFRLRALALVVTLPFLLAGCGVLSDDAALKALISPGKFDLYACKDIEAYGRKTKEREEELQQAMARAEQSSGGQLVNLVAYRNEYVQVRAELASLAAAAANKNCKSQSPWASERSLF
jgi:hypothetical protein